MAAGGCRSGSVLAVIALLTARGLQHQAEARVIAAAVLPHGDFAFDPGLINGANGSAAIHNASQTVGTLLSSLAPDVVLLSTPHGIALSNDFGIYLSSNASGTALIGGDLHNASFPLIAVPMAFGLDGGLTADLAGALAGAGFNVSGILPFADSLPIAISWGEIVPLSFVAGLNNSYAGAVALLSQPLRRMNQSAAMVPELLALGAALFDLLEPLPQRVALVISADLAHTHANPVDPYGNSSAAVPFDEACCAWAQSLNGTWLTEVAAGLEQAALSCGFTGLVMAHGLMAAAAAAAADGLARADGLGAVGADAASGAGANVSAAWQPQLWGYAAPTYYGMMAATFTRL
jgi:aromatic ring-opening dioxygenase LigB subunit